MQNVAYDNRTGKILMALGLTLNMGLFMGYRDASMGI